MWSKELEVARKAAVKAGREIMKVYESDFSNTVEYKTDNSPLTRADKASNDIIVSILRGAFPTYAILSEEEKDDKERMNNPFCFIVDPLDGTKEFIKRNGQFTVNIALAYKNRPVMGIIYVPATGDLFYASQNEGAYLAKPSGEKEKLHVSANVDRSILKAVVSGSHSCEEMERMIEEYQIKDLLRIGSSLKGCLVAKGDADIYFRHNPTMEWDTAAMQCIVEEAGGIFRQMDDSEMTYNRENSLNGKGFYAINRIENRLY